MDLLLFLKIEILCWRIMTPSLRGGSISLGYYTFNRTAAAVVPRSTRIANRSNSNGCFDPTVFRQLNPTNRF
ncbi:hypothetical protein D6219_10740 [Coxiella burnetii]|nr:hypothetical protein D6219_10740 [Coxiella burnetii]